MRFGWAVAGTTLSMGETSVVQVKKICSGIVPGREISASAALRSMKNVKSLTQGPARLGAFIPLDPLKVCGVELKKWRTIGMLAFPTATKKEAFRLPKSLEMKMVGRAGFEPA